MKKLQHSKKKIRSRCSSSRIHCIFFYNISMCFNCRKFQPVMPKAQISVAVYNETKNKIKMKVNLLFWIRMYSLIFLKFSEWQDEKWFIKFIKYYSSLKNLTNDLVKISWCSIIGMGNLDKWKWMKVGTILQSEKKPDTITLGGPQRVEVVFKG